MGVKTSKKTKRDLELDLASLRGQIAALEASIRELVERLLTPPAPVYVPYPVPAATPPMYPWQPTYPPVIPFSPTEKWFDVTCGPNDVCAVPMMLGEVGVGTLDHGAAAPPYAAGRMFVTNEMPTAFAASPFY